MNRATASLKPIASVDDDSYFFAELKTSLIVSWREEDAVDPTFFDVDSFSTCKIKYSIANNS